MGPHITPGGCRETLLPITQDGGVHCNPGGDTAGVESARFPRMQENQLKGPMIPTHESEESVLTGRYLRW